MILVFKTLKPTLEIWSGPSDTVNVTLGNPHDNVRMFNTSQWSASSPGCELQFADTSEHRRAASFSAEIGETTQTYISEHEQKKSS